MLIILCRQTHRRPLESCTSPIAATPTHCLRFGAPRFFVVVVVIFHAWESSGKNPNFGLKQESSESGDSQKASCNAHFNRKPELLQPGYFLLDLLGSPSCFAGAGDNVMHRRVCKPQPPWSAIDQDVCLASGKLHHSAMINVAHVEMMVV